MRFSQNKKGGDILAHIQKIYYDEDETKLKGYRVFVDLGKDTKGNRKRKSKLFRTKKEAENWMAEQVISKNTGQIINPTDITFKSFALRWINQIKKPHIAATTYESYKIIIEKHLILALKGIKLQDIKPFHLEQYFGMKRAEGRRDNKTGGLSENTLKKHYITLNQIFNKAKKSRIIKYNPISDIESPQPEDYEAPTMNTKEINDLLKVVKKDNIMFIFIYTALMTGMRKSELLGLEWADVDLDKGIVEVKKRLVQVTEAERGVLHEEATKTSSSRRKIKISNKLCSLLNEHQKHQKEMRLKLGSEYDDSKQFVFARPDGKHYHPRYFNRNFNRYLDKAELSQEYNIHTLRHTFATLNLENKINPKIVQSMLGHSTIATTLDIYSHVDIDLQQEAVNKLEDNINVK